MAVEQTHPSYTPIVGRPLERRWGEAVSLALIQRFASVAQRDTEWASPPDGALCLLLDTSSMWIFRNTSWRKILTFIDDGSIVIEADTSVSNLSVSSGKVSFGNNDYIQHNDASNTWAFFSDGGQTCTITTGYLSTGFDINVSRNANVGTARLNSSGLSFVGSPAITATSGSSLTLASAATLTSNSRLTINSQGAPKRGSSGLHHLGSYERFWQKNTGFTTLSSSWKTVLGPVSFPSINRGQGEIDLYGEAIFDFEASTSNVGTAIGRIEFLQPQFGSWVPAGPEAVFRSAAAGNRSCVSSYGWQQTSLSAGDGVWQMRLSAKIGGSGGVTSGWNCNGIHTTLHMHAVG